MTDEQIDEAIETLARACNVENRSAVTQALRRIVNSGGEITASAPSANAEPVAWFDARDGDYSDNFFWGERKPSFTGDWQPLYAAPLATPSDKQEVVAWQYLNSDGNWACVHAKQLDQLRKHGFEVRPLYAAPLATPSDKQEALESIYRYGADTLSGRIDGPDDRDWQRAAVREMTRRARKALDANPSDKQEAVKAHAIDCEYIQSDNPWAECTCGFGGPNDAASLAIASDKQEAVCWAAYNGVCLQAFFKSEEAANRYAAEMQKNHDLSGSLAAFSVKPLYAAPLAQSAEQDRIDTLLNDHIELNMSNYSDDDVSALNEWAIRAYDFIKGASK